MPTPDWNSIPDPGGIAANRPNRYQARRPAEPTLSRGPWPDSHARGSFDAGDVFKFAGTTNGTFTNGSSYTVLAVNLYAFLPCTVATTGLNSPDSVVLTGNVIVSVDYLIQYFTRTTAASTANQVGNQIPLVP